MSKILKQTFVGILFLGFASTSWGLVKIVKSSQISTECKSIGYFEGDSGHGRSINGTQVALYRAKEKANDSGANFAVIVELNRGPGDQGGYCLLEGFVCPTE